MEDELLQLQGGGSSALPPPPPQSISKYYYWDDDAAAAAEGGPRRRRESMVNKLISTVYSGPTISDIESALSFTGAGDQQQQLVISMDHAQRNYSCSSSSPVFRNIEAAKQIGLRTVLVGTSERKKGADHALESLHNMKEALPELWEEAEKDEDVRNSSKVGIETSVIA